MSDQPFHQTSHGRRFYEQQQPDLLRQLAAIRAALERIAKVVEEGRQSER